MSKRVITILPALWFILFGAIEVFNLHFDHIDTVMGLLALATGIVMLIKSA